jgi:hypothetical protein
LGEEGGGGGENVTELLGSLELRSIVLFKAHMVRYIKKNPFPQAKKAHGKTVGISFWGCLCCSDKGHLKKKMHHFFL